MGNISASLRRVGDVGVLNGGGDLGPELLLAGLGPPQGVEKVLELVLSAARPEEGLHK